MKNKLKLKEVVEKVLEKDERARGDDKWLVYKVMQEYTRIFIPYEDFEKIPSFEAITRSKRIIQHQENRFNDNKEVLDDPCITFEKPIKNER